MALPLTCPRGHQWQPDGRESPTATPAVCPVCGLLPRESRAAISPTLDFQSELTPVGTPASVMPLSPPLPTSPARSNVTSSDAATIPRGAEDASRRDIKVLSQHIPGYEILGELGRGGMGVVYKARQASLNRIVALKMVLAGAQADPQQLDRFRAEAEAVARLQHGNIVQIYEISEFEGCPFFSLEYVDGGTLAQKLNGAPSRPAWPLILSASSPRPFTVPICAASFIAISSPATFCWPSPASTSPARTVFTPRHRGRCVSMASPRSPTSAWPNTSTASRRRAPAPSSAHRATWPPNKPRVAPTPSDPPPTSTRWAPSSTRCSRANRLLKGTAR